LSQEKEINKHDTVIDKTDKLLANSFANNLGVALSLIDTFPNT